MTTRRARATRRILAAPHLPIAAYLGLVGATSTTALDEAVAWWLNAAWSFVLVLGTLLIVWGVAADRTRAESVGHMFHLFALALLGAVSLAAIGGGDVLALATLAAVSGLRMRVLRRARAARREAGQILAGEDR